MSEAVSAEVAAVIPVDRLVRIYVKIRDTKSALKKQYEAEAANFDDQMKSISVELRRRAQAEGVDGYKTAAGTVYLATDFKVSCGDWAAFYAWARENDELEMFERRIKAEPIKQYMEEHDGALPPGVSVFKELEARVRRSNGQ